MRIKCRAQGFEPGTSQMRVRRLIPTDRTTQQLVVYLIINYEQLPNVLKPDLDNILIMYDLS